MTDHPLLTKVLWDALEGWGAIENGTWVSFHPKDAETLASYINANGRADVLEAALDVCTHEYAGGVCGVGRSIHDFTVASAGRSIHDFTVASVHPFVPAGDAVSSHDTPATEAGRRLLAAGNGEDPILPDDWLGSILAIEAEARSDEWAKGHESGMAAERGRHLMECEVARSVPTRPGYQPNGLPVPPEVDPADWPPDGPTRPDECQCSIPVHPLSDHEPLTVERLAAALRQAAGPDGAYPSPARILAALGIGEASK